jgi:hypothetical protein
VILEQFSWPTLSAESDLHMAHHHIVRSIRALALVLFSALSAAGHAEEPSLCLANACLGMTVAQAKSLELEPTNSYSGIVFKKGIIADTYGLAADGTRVWFDGLNFDKKTLAEFSQRVKTICAVNIIGAKMKASDGQPISLTFRPMMRNGHGELILTQIERTLPPTLSASQMGEVIKQAKARYGVSFSKDYPVFPEKPTVSIRNQFTMGSSVSLVLPYKENVWKALNEQPGCSDKAKLE